MQIGIEKINPTIAVIHLTGRMDVESSPAVRQTLMELADQGFSNLVVDLSQVDFMDSSGLSALVTGMKTLRKINGVLSLCGPNTQIRTTLRLTMLDMIFPVFDTVDQALGSSPSN
jgi:anti-sigma B factor antagonist